MNNSTHDNAIHDKTTRDNATHAVIQELPHQFL
jgi:hypothetical protein